MQVPLFKAPVLIMEVQYHAREELLVCGHNSKVATVQGYSYIFEGKLP